MSNNKFKVLIVEDEANICSFIETLLTTNDYQALVAHTCTMGLTLFASHNPDLVILDLGLPDRDGLEFIRTVRQKYMTPIVVLSARTDEMDKIEALDLGANDYITKPFSTGELLARVRAALRLNRYGALRGGNAPAGEFRAQGMRINYKRQMQPGCLPSMHHMWNILQSHLNMKYRRWRNLPIGSGRRKQSIHILLPSRMERCLGMRMPDSFMLEKRMRGQLRRPSM